MTLGPFKGGFINITYLVYYITMLLSIRKTSCAEIAAPDAIPNRFSLRITH